METVEDTFIAGDQTEKSLFQFFPTHPALQSFKGTPQRGGGLSTRGCEN